MRACSLRAEQHFPIVRTAAVAIVLLGIAQATPAETTASVLGRTIYLTPPTGFCIVDGSDYAKEFHRLIQNANAEEGLGELVHLSAPCKDLREVAAGKRSRISQWAQVVVVGDGSKLTLVNSPRQKFLADTGKALGARPLDIKRISEIANRSQPKGVLVTANKKEVLGVTNEAIFVTGVGVYELDGGQKTSFAVTAGLTLANQLPIGMYIYVNTQLSSEPLMPILAPWIKATLANN